MSEMRFLEDRTEAVVVAGFKLRGRDPGRQPVHARALPRVQSAIHVGAARRPGAGARVRWGGHDAEPPAGGTVSELVDIGHNVRIEVRRMPDGEVAGVYYEHPCVGGSPSPGWVPVKQGREGWAESDWDLVSTDPLTLSPSLLCPMCKHHGFIRVGRWVPA